MLTLCRGFPGGGALSALPDATLSVRAPGPERSDELLRAIETMAASVVPSDRYEYLELLISSLEVEIHADYDVRGELGVADVPSGYLQIRYTVRIGSDAPESEIMKVLDTADEHSSYVEIFSTEQDLRREVEIVKAGG